MLAEGLLAIHRFDVVAQQEVGLRKTARFEAGKGGAGSQQHDKRDNPRGARTLGNQRADTTPAAAHALESGDLLCSCGFDLLLAPPGHEGPERCTAKDHQNSRQERDRSQEREPDAEGRNGTERLVGVEVAKEQAEERNDNRRGRGTDGLERSAEGSADSRPLRLNLEEGFSISGDHEQGVVGGRTDDENRENSLTLARNLDEVV